MELTREQLKKCYPFATDQNIDRFLKPINLTLAKFDINTPARVAAFLAQLGHESGSLKYVREIASGEAYEGRKDLGNVNPGDGKKYKGRGLIQITGRTNYDALSRALNYDFLLRPESLELPGPAAMSAGWFWKKTGLNELADQNTDDSFKRMTKKINGGYNGLEDRVRHRSNCKKAFAL